MNLRELLEKLQTGELSLDRAEEFLRGYGIASVGLHRIDTHRKDRAALPEIVFGLGKSAEQLTEIALAHVARELPLLVTRVDRDKASALTAAVPNGSYNVVGQTFRAGFAQEPVAGRVAVVSAGSSDEAVAEEAAATLEFSGVAVERVYDSGVAGLHRLFSAGERLHDADVLIVVAGMDGALPSVVGGLFRQPVIAVPTSVGYGASFQGLAPLLTMLNACAPGITVVNIDNGFGAAAAALSILKLIDRKTRERPLAASMEDSLRDLP